MTDTSQPVLVQARDRKLYITLNRPEVLNAQNQPLREDLVGAIERLEADPDLLVGIIYGAGGRAFSAGADLKEVRSPSGSRRPLPEQHDRKWVHFEAVRWASKPIIAATCVLNGLLSFENRTSR